MKKDSCEQLYNSLLSKVNADSCECSIRQDTENLTRFANSSIHQSVRSDKTSIHLRLIKGQKSGYSSTNDLSENGLEQLLQSAMLVMENNESDEELYPLPKASEYDAIPFPYMDLDPAFDDPEQRANIVNSYCIGAQKHGVQAFGTVSSVHRSIFIANTNGVKAYHSSTLAETQCQMMKDTASGFAQSSSPFIKQLETERVLEESLWACLNSMNIQAVEAKPYEVILKPEAVEDVLQMLKYMGFSTSAIHENRSFLSGKVDELVFDPDLSITDNAWDARQIPLPFDFEGAPKKTVPLVVDGVFRNLVTDAKWARKLKLENTGHGLPAPNPWGPVPMHLVLEGKKQRSQEEMISDCAEGLLITRFWYANPAHPKKAIATGLTRDGTFLIKNGKIQHAVNNLRYTDSLVKVLSNVLSCGNIMRLHDMTVTPALHCKNMNFTGQASS
jgi:PmbA protein